jgi:outer membrane protein assembly factor BamE (lipoprotein component of BamABCDE complex)
MLSLRCAVLWIVLLQMASCAGESGGAKVDVSNVEVGMTQSQLLSLLGQPLMHETYGPTEFLFYPSSTGSNIPIAIVDGKVTSIGRAAYDIVVRSKAQTDGNAPPPRKREAP